MSCGVSPTSRPSGISDWPEGCSRSICARGTTVSISFGPRSVTLDDDSLATKPEMLSPDFVFQVELLLRQRLGLSYLSIFQSVLHRDRDLARYLRKEPEINLAEGILLPSAEAQETEDTIPANKWQEATGFEALGDGWFILQT